MQASAKLVERVLPDRRRVHPLLGDWRWSFCGRRESFRRDEMSSRAVLDRYPPGLVAMAVAITILSAIDAGFTLIMLEQGVVTESNPLMNVLLSIDTRLFLVIKMFITGAGVVGLVMYGRLKMFGQLRLHIFLGLRGSVWVDIGIFG